MSFPDRDSFWSNTYAFVKNHFHPQDNIVAPQEFREKFDRVTDYLLIDREDRAKNFQWIILHKGQLELIEIDFLKQTQRDLNPVYANEVFVVFTTRDSLPKLELDSLHLQSLADYLTKTSYPKNKSDRHTQVTAPTSLIPAVYLGNYTALIKNKYGHKMYLDTRDCSLTPHLLLDGTWEPWITKLFLSLVKPGMQVVEIGSNIGYYSLLAASRIGKDGFIYCFEANPHLCQLLQKNININGYTSRVKCFNKAVTNELDKIKFRIDKNYLGGSYICFSPLQEQPDQFVEIIEVESTFLDKELESCDRVDLLKIDAEGAEPLIIKGAEKFLRKNQDIKIIMEFNLDYFTAKYGDRNPEEHLKILRDLGFKINLIDETASYHPVSNAQILNNPENQELLIFR
jgi:FkbM family methyltransferase